MNLMVRVQFVLDSWKAIRKDVAGAVLEFPAAAFGEPISKAWIHLERLRATFSMQGTRFPAF